MLVGLRAGLIQLRTWVDAKSPRVVASLNTVAAAADRRGMVHPKQKLVALALFAVTLGVYAQVVWNF